MRPLWGTQLCSSCKAKPSHYIRMIGTQILRCTNSRSPDNRSRFHRLHGRLLSPSHQRPHLIRHSLMRNPLINRSVRVTGKCRQMLCVDKQCCTKRETTHSLGYHTSCWLNIAKRRVDETGQNRRRHGCALEHKPEPKCRPASTGDTLVAQNRPTGINPSGLVR